MDRTPNAAFLREFAERCSDLYASYLLCVLVLGVPPRAGGYSTILEWKLMLFIVGCAIYGCAVLPCFVFECAQRRSRIGAPQIAALGYLLSSALSAAASPYFPKALLGGSRHEGFATLACYVLTFVLLSRYLRLREGHLRLLGAVTAVFCLITVLQLRGDNPLHLYPQGLTFFDADKAYAGVFVATAGNADFSAALLAMAGVVFTLALAHRPHDRRWLLPLLGTVLALLLRLDVSGAIVAYVFSVALFLPWQVRSKRRLLCGAEIALGIALLCAAYSARSGTLGEIGALLRGEADIMALSGRPYIWQQLFPFIAQRPWLGWGADTVRFLELSPFYWTNAQGECIPSFITAAHCDYLDVLLSQGIVGLLLYLALLSSVFASLRRGARPGAWLCGGAAAVYLIWALVGIRCCAVTPLALLALAGCCSEVDIK